jgi:hypothetical protein
MNKSTQFKLKLGKAALFVAVASAAILVPDLASADASAEVQNAITQGQALVGVVAPGIIGVAAIMTGVALVVSWIRK